MIYRFEINRPWVVSPGASRVYLVSAVLATLFYACKIGVSLALSVAASRWSDISWIVAVPLFLTQLVSVIGTAVLWVAMMYYWYSFDPRSDGARGVWLLVLLLGPLGSLIYYFAVYRRYSRTEFAPNRHATFMHIL
jgi:hypothetical protein